jgi:hypothetical protein
MKTPTPRQMQDELFGLATPAQETSPRIVVRRVPDDPMLRRRVGDIAQTSMERELPCQYLGTMPLFDGPRVYPGQETDWGLVRLKEDPLYKSRDGYPMPTQVVERLSDIHDSGISFDTIYVAHEVERGALVEGRPINPLAVIPPAPPSVQRRSRKLGRIAELFFKVAAAPLMAWSVASMAVAAAGVAAGAAAIALPLLDPIIFGVVVRPGSEPRAGEIGCWFYLAHWRYGEDER